MPDMDVGMPLCTIVAVGVRFLLHFDRDGHKPAMPHPPLGDDMFGEMMNFARFSAQQRDLHAAGMVEMNLHGGDRQIVMLVMRLGKTIGELPHGAIVDIDERGDAIAVVAGAAARLLHAGTSEVTDSLRPVVIPAPLHIALKFRDELIVESDGHPLHRILSPGCCVFPKLIFDRTLSLNRPMRI